MVMIRRKQNTNSIAQKRGFRDNKQQKTPHSAEIDYSQDETGKDEENRQPDAELGSSFLDELFPTTAVSTTQDTTALTRQRRVHAYLATQGRGEHSGNGGQAHDPLARWLESKEGNGEEEEEEEGEGEDAVSELPGRGAAVRQRWEATSDAGTVTTSKSSYLEDLEHQIQQNKAKKTRQQQEEKALEAKLSRERDTGARYGGGGEPHRSSDGEVVACLRRAAWTFESEHPSPPGSRGTSPARARATQPISQKTPAKSACRRPPAGEGPPAAPKRDVVADGEDGLRQENGRLRQEVARLQAQMGHILEALTLERQRNLAGAE